MLSFTTKDGESKCTQLVSENESVVSAISPSLGYLASIRNNQQTGVISAADFNQLQNQLSGFKNARSMSDMAWRQLGPNNFGGRTRAIIFDNQDAASKTILAAGVTGGIWKSTDVGISWHKTNGSYFNLNVSCMKQDANGTIYAGTGESFATETVSGLSEMGFTSGFMGQGIYKSIDGNSFSLIQSTTPQFNDDTSEWAFVNELAVDMNSGKLYAATNTGIKYSDNGGDTWSIPYYSFDTLYTSVLKNYVIACDSFEIVSSGVYVYGPDTTSILIDTVKMNTIKNEFELLGNATDVAVNVGGDVVVSVDNKCYVFDNARNVFRNVSAYPDNSDIMHNDSTSSTVTLVPLNNQSDTTYTDITGEWHLYTDLHQTKLPSSNVGRIEFAFAPSDDNVLYTTVINNDGFLYNIYRSDNKGNTWRIIQPGTTSVNIFDGQGIYDNTLTVFPENPDKILVGGIDAWELTKVQETGYFASRNISTGFATPFSPHYLHNNHHVYVFQSGSNNTFLVGNDGGVSIGMLVEGDFVFEGSNRSYYTTQFYNIAASGVENYVLGGSQGNGTILIDGAGSSVNEGEMIYPSADHSSDNLDGGACVVSVINKDVLVVSSAGSVPGSDPAVANIQRSEDGGANYSSQFVSTLDINTDVFNTPMALWENFNNTNSRDSVWFFNRSESIPILGGTKIQVRSNNSGQPFYYEIPADETILPGDSILVQDIVSSRYFIATSDIMYMTNELHLFAKTPEWFTISNKDVGFEGSSQCISYSSDVNHVFVGTREGRLFRVSNLALAYNYDRADVNSPECIVSTREIILENLNGQVITSIAVDPQNPENVMVTLGNYGNDQYVLYSGNALDENPVFSSRQGNLPQMPVYSSIIEMSDSNIGIIGTEHGIFVTENIQSESPVWMLQDSLLGSVPVFQLQQQIVNKTSDTVYLVNGGEITKIPYQGTNNFGNIYAATYGRGLFRSNAFRKPVGVDEIYNDNEVDIFNLHVYPNPITSYATIEFDALDNSNAELFIYDLSGRKILSRVNSVQKGLNKIDLDLSNLNSGTYVIQVVIGSSVYSQKIITN